MTYEVLRDFNDSDFKVLDADGNKVPLSKTVGEKFIPAEVHYPQNRVDARVFDGTLKLIGKSTPQVATDVHGPAV